MARLTCLSRKLKYMWTSLTVCSFVQWLDRQTYEILIVSAIVTITQHFWQYSPDGLERAKYIFPIPARSAICGFKMTAPDGTVVTAIAKEKEEAKREHEAAISQGYMTGLVEHVTDDSELVFFLLCAGAY